MITKKKFIPDFFETERNKFDIEREHIKDNKSVKVKSNCYNFLHLRNFFVILLLLIFTFKAHIIKSMI
jgi:hypothetical protein